MRNFPKSSINFEDGNGFNEGYAGYGDGGCEGNGNGSGYGNNVIYGFSFRNSYNNTFVINGYYPYILIQYWT